MILEYFEEDVDQMKRVGQCCDTCSQAESTETVDCQEEMIAIGKAVKGRPNRGEKKVMVHYSNAVTSARLRYKTCYYHRLRNG